MDSANTSQDLGTIGVVPLSMDQLQRLARDMDKTCLELGFKGMQAFMAVAIFLKSVGLRAGLTLEQMHQILDQVPKLDIEFRKRPDAPIPKGVN